MAGRTFVFMILDRYRRPRCSSSRSRRRCSSSARESHRSGRCCNCRTEAKPKRGKGVLPDTILFIFYFWGKAPKPPLLLLRRSRRWEKFGGPDVPVRAPGGVGQAQRAKATVQGAVAMAEPKRNRCNASIHPCMVTVPERR